MPKPHKFVVPRLGPEAALARRRGGAGVHKDRRTKRNRSRTDQRLHWRKDQT